MLVCSVDVLIMLYMISKEFSSLSKDNVDILWYQKNAIIPTNAFMKRFKTFTGQLVIKQMDKPSKNAYYLAPIYYMLLGR